MTKDRHFHLTRARESLRDAEASLQRAAETFDEGTDRKLLVVAAASTAASLETVVALMEEPR